MKEDINRVELRGRIGSIRVNESEGTALLALATNRVYKNRDGQAVIETMWHNVRVNGEMTDLSALKKCGIAHVRGFLHLHRYTGTDGALRDSLEVWATECEVENEE